MQFPEWSRFPLVRFLALHPSRKFRCCVRRKTKCPIPAGQRSLDEFWHEADDCLDWLGSLRSEPRQRVEFVGAPAVRFENRVQCHRQGWQECVVDCGAGGACWVDEYWQGSGQSVQVASGEILLLDAKLP